MVLESGIDYPLFPTLTYVPNVPRSIECRFGRPLSDVCQDHDRDVPVLYPTKCRGGEPG